MTIRFKIDSVANYNSSICGIVGAVIPTSVNLQIFVKNVSVYNGTYGSFAISTTPVTFNVVTGVLETGNIVALKITNVLPADSCNVRIIITDGTNTYRGYNKSFTFYGYDVGNNSALGITHNQDFNIWLSLVAGNNNSGLSTIAQASFLALHKPFTKNITIYRTDSNVLGGSGTTMAVYDDTTSQLLLRGEGNICVDDYGLITLRETISINSGASVCSVTKTLNVLDYLPTLTIGNNCTDCTDCAQIDSSNDFVVTLQFTNLLWIDDTEGNPVAILTLNWELYSNVGDLLSSGVAYDDTYTSLYSYTYTIQGVTGLGFGDNILKVCYTNYGTVTSARDELTTGDTYIAGHWYVITQYGDDIEELVCADHDLDNDDTLYHSYVLPIDGGDGPDNGSVFVPSHGGIINDEGESASIINEIIATNTCCTSIVIKGCNTFDIKQDDCSHYTITNNSLDIVTFTVSSLDGTTVEDGTLTEISTTELEANTSATLTFDTDGIYVISQENGDSNIIAIYCQLESCLLGYVKLLACKDMTKKCDCEDCGCVELDYYNFNALMLSAFTYFNLIQQSDFLQTYSISDIEEGKLAELYEIKTFFEKFEVYCDSCPETTDGCGNCG